MNTEFHRLAAWFLAGVLTVWLVAMIAVLATAQRPTDGRVAVVFSPSTNDEQAISAITRAGARPIDQGWLRWVWAVDLDNATPARLEAAGAMLVIREFAFVAVLGCAGPPPAAALPFSNSQ